MFLKTILPRLNNWTGMQGEFKGVAIFNRKRNGDSKSPHPIKQKIRLIEKRPDFFTCYCYCQVLI
jgi:predicted Rdx family selenoprotein